MSSICDTREEERVGTGAILAVRSARPRVSASRVRFPVGMGIKGKGEDAGIKLLCPTWIRRIFAVGIIGFDSIFRWDTLRGSGRFHDRLDHRSAVKETTLYHPPTGEPDRQANQRVDGGPVGRFRPEDANLVELLDDAGCRLTVTAPQSGKFNLGSLELPGL